MRKIIYYQLERIFAIFMFFLYFTFLAILLIPNIFYSDSNNNMRRRRIYTNAEEYGNQNNEIDYHIMKEIKKMENMQIIALVA